MTTRDFLAGEFIDIIEWLDDSNDTIVWRFSRPANEIKNGAQLIVRPGQVAVFVDQGDIADVFVPGRHELTTQNLPVLSRLRGWRYGFQSPFKADVIFVSTKQFVNRMWGTSNPVIVRDPQLGPVRLRAFGSYAVRVQDPSRFVCEIAGTNAVFAVGDIDAQLRDLVVARVSSALADGGISVIDLAATYADLGVRVQQTVAPQFQQYGLEITQLVIENVSLPPEVEAAIDQHARLNVIGSLSAYSQLQNADAIRDAARNPGGSASAGLGVGIAAGFMTTAANATKPATSFDAVPTSGAAPASTTSLGPGPAAAPASAPLGANEPPPLPQADWYYVVDGARCGPAVLQSLRALANAGKVNSGTLFWKAGMAGWVPAADVSELATLFS